MKMMTCRQIGGPCDEPIYGNTADEMMQNGEKHIMSMGDPAHQEAVKMMAETATNPDAGKKWNDEFMVKFNALVDQ